MYIYISYVLNFLEHFIIEVQKKVELLDARELVVGAGTRSTWRCFNPK